MREFRAAALTLGLCLALPLSAVAQTLTGGILGTVRDKTGAVLPGVSVSVSGPNIVGSQTVVTNDSGLYRVTNLPPGSYDLQFTLDGFATLAQRGLRVSVGTIVEANASLQVGGVAEKVEVLAETPVVDTSSNKVGANLDQQFVDNIPNRRFSFFDLVASVPGSVMASDRVGPHTGQTRTMVYGSSYDDNAFKLDGVDITDSYWGEALAEPNVDAIEEVEVLSLGAPAEYGHAPGAIYNVVTRQGTNTFHGVASFFGEPSSWTGNNTEDKKYPDGKFVDGCPTAADPGKQCPYELDKYYDFSVQLGGPMIKDKLWFFASYQGTRNAFSEPGVDPSYGTATLNRDRFFGKVNWQISKDHKLVGTFHLDKGREDAALGATEAATAAHSRLSTTPAPGLSYTGVLSPKTVLEVRYSGFYGSVHGEPTDPNAPLSGTRFYDLDTAQITGSPYYFYEIEPYNRQTATVKLSHLADDFLGADHNFRFGVQYGSAEAAGTYGYNDIVWTYMSNGTKMGYGYDKTPFTYNGSSRSVGVFVDDTATVNERLSLNLGVRYDYDKAYSPEQTDCVDLELGHCTPTGVVYPKVTYFTWNSVSPRLGFNWKVTSDGKTALKGFWGRYHRSVATAEFANEYGPQIKPTLYGTDYNFQTVEFGTLVPIYTPTNLSVSPDYGSPYTDQFTASLERQLGKDAGITLNYVHKYGKDFAAWQPIGGVFTPVTYIDSVGAGATNQSVTVYRLDTPREQLSYVLDNDPGMWLRADVIDLNLVKRMSGNWYLNASLTWMKSTGRLSQSRDGVELRQLGGMQFRDFGRDPNDFVNTDGRQRGDQEWQFKAQGVYKLPWDLQISGNIRSFSNAWLVRQARVSSLTNMNTTILVQKRGENGRLPAVTLVDLRLEKAFKLSRGVQLLVSADAFNLLNNDSYWRVRNSRVDASVFNYPSTFVRPRQIMLGAKLRF